MTAATLDRPPATPAGPAPTRPLAAVLAAVGIPIFMVTLDNLVVTTALPSIRTALGASITDLHGSSTRTRCRSPPSCSPPRPWATGSAGAGCSSAASCCSPWPPRPPRWPPSRGS
jgi:hypothetical protein